MTPPPSQDKGLPDNLPVLTEIADEADAADLPTLTDIVPESPDLSAEEAWPIADALAGTVVLDENGVRQLLLHLEAHIEKVLTYQLNLNLEQLQRSAIQHAVNDLKAALPALLQEVRSKHPGL